MTYSSQEILVRCKNQTVLEIQHIFVRNSLQIIFFYSSGNFVYQETLPHHRILPEDRDLRVQARLSQTQSSEGKLAGASFTHKTGTPTHGSVRTFLHCNQWHMSQPKIPGCSELIRSNSWCREQAITERYRRGGLGKNKDQLTPQGLSGSKSCISLKVTNLSVAVLLFYFWRK